MLGRLAEGDDFQKGSEGGVEEQRQPYDMGPDIASSGLLGISNANVWAQEEAEIRARRGAVLGANSATADDLVGLALSGGGIRSATFALGVVERLARKGFLAHVDYLSTVSGGGYLGAFISSFLDSNRADVGPGANRSPFAPNSPVESAAVRHLRNHSKYLIEGSRVARLRVIGQVVYGIFANLLIVCPFILVLASLTVAFKNEAIHRALTSSLQVEFSWPVIVILGVMLLLGLGLALVQNLSRLGPKWASFREYYEVGTAVWLAVTFLACAFDLLPVLFAGHQWLVSAHPGLQTALKPLLVPVLNGVLVVATQKFPRVSRWLLELLWVSGPLALLAFYVSLTQFLVQAQAAAGHGVSWLQIPVPVGTAVVPWWIIFAIDVAVIVYGYVFLNINLTSLHRFYRDRLANAYLLKPADPPAHSRSDAQQTRQTVGTGSSFTHALSSGKRCLESCG